VWNAKTLALESNLDCSNVAVTAVRFDATPRCGSSIESPEWSMESHHESRGNHGVRRRRVGDARRPVDVSAAGAEDGSLTVTDARQRAVRFR